MNDSAFLRESVDFSDLLEDSVEREEDRKKKCVLCVRMVSDFRGYKFSKPLGFKFHKWLSTCKKCRKESCTQITNHIVCM